ncbi:hypothetical protein [Speluncibacter jeojiensis]|uniref:hypothetical protein n=1 Tax=Speluncibacter jeojiensis TaxID=2710754 RepID=UPI00241091B4|nr:hypothetical protein [Rhodococcus sp. D2-41]
MSTDRVIHRAEALRRGHTDEEIRRLCTTGAWTRLRRGVYLLGEDSAEDRSARHRHLIQATAECVCDRTVISHASAAILHGFDLWATDLRRVHLTRDRTHGARTNPLVHVHSAPIDADEICEVGGLRVTTPARTLADLSRTLSFEQAVVVGDSALHRTKLTKDEARQALRARPRRPGNVRAARAIEFLDDRSEGVGESRSRVRLHLSGITDLELQQNFLSPDGIYLGRTDFFDPTHGVIGEFDGKVKYGKYLKPGQDPGDAVFLEKQREDALRDAGFEVVRWIWRELDDMAAVALRFRRARARAHAHRPDLTHCACTSRTNGVM